MTIKEYYENYNTNKKLNITLPINTAVTVKDFYNNCVKYNMLPLDSVIAWHNMFMEYVEMDDAIFWVRYYESGSKKNGRWNTRRGCKTQFRDGFSYVFVSNFDAHEIFNMVRLGVKPDANEFLDLMKNNKFPLHYDSSKSCEESDVAPYSFPQIGSIRGGILTPDHWYLAHIIGVKSDYIDLDGNVLEVNIDRLYPRGEVADWKLDSNGKMVRYIDDTLSQEEKALVKAHFLRFVDPLNYYAAPGQNYQNNSAAYNIGEAQVVNDYIGTVFSDIYGHVNMKGFRKQALASDKLISDENAEINAEFGNQILSGKVKSKPSKTVKRANAPGGFSVYEQYDKISKRKKPTKDDFTVYSSDYIAISIYNKYMEMLKEKEGVFPHHELERAKNIVRIEIRCMEGKIKALKKTSLVMI